MLIKFGFRSNYIVEVKLTITKHKFSKGFPKVKKIKNQQQESKEKALFRRKHENERKNVQKDIQKENKLKSKKMRWLCGISINKTRRKNKKVKGKLVV